MRIIKLNLYQIACLYLLLSFFIDPLSAAWNGPSLVIFGDVFIITIVSYILIANKYKSYTIWSIVLVAFAFTGMLMNLRYGINIEICKLVLKSRAVFVFLVTIFFYLYVFSKLENDKLIKLDSFFEKIIQFNILILLLEGAALNFFGMSDILKQIFHEAGYRISAYSGVFGIAPNGLVFGRQNASILSIIGIIRWFPWNSDWLRTSLRKSIWLIASTIALSLTMTTTSILCFVSVVAFVYIFGLARKFRWCIICLVILSPFIVLKYYDIYIINKVGHIRTKEQVRENTEKVIYAFTQRFQVIKEKPFETIIGGGNVPARYSPKYLAKMKSGDFGFLSINIKYGALLISILCVSYLLYILKILLLRYRYKSKNPEMDIIIRSFVISLALILSLIHYTTLFANGMMQLFAATTALSYVMMKRYVEDRKYEKYALFNQKTN